MQLFKKLFAKNQPANVSMEFYQAKNFKGFKKYKISNYDYPEAQENLRMIKSVNPKMDLNGTVIRLDLITCVNNTEALAVFVADLRIGTIFFSNSNYSELRTAFANSKISAACVRITDLNDYYLFVKLED